MIASLLKATTQVATLATWIGGAVLILLCLMVTGDVAARHLFGITLGGSDELSGYAFGMVTTWGLAYTLLHRGHIRIDVVHARFSPGVRAVLDLVSLLALGALGVAIAYYGYSVLDRSLELSTRSNTPLAVPLWIPQLVWWTGLLFFLFTLTLLTIATAAALFARDLKEVDRLAGIPRDGIDEVEVREHIQREGN